MTVSPELAAFAGRVQELVVEFIGRLDVSTTAGSLIGSGIELGLRNGITAQMLHDHFTATMPRISKMVAEGSV